MLQRQEIERVERVEREKERLHELEVLQLRKGTGNAPSTRSLPKLPVLEETDDIDAYIFRFEKYAAACSWPEDLSALLKGTPLGMYHRLSCEAIIDSGKVKRSLLRRCQKLKKATGRHSEE